MKNDTFQHGIKIKPKIILQGPYFFLRNITKQER